MLAELEAAPPAPGPPDGIVPQAFDPDREARAFHAAREEALPDHWDHGPLPFEAWRERRLAAPGFDPTLLLLRCFAEFHRRGERRVFLYGDADSPTGANRLYERAGMHADWAAEISEKELRPGAVPVRARDVR